MAVRAVPWKEHADEAVENFLIIQIFHCASSVSSPRRFSNWWFMTHLLPAVKNIFLFRISSKLQLLDCV